MSTNTLVDELNKEHAQTVHRLALEPDMSSAIWGRFVEPYLSGVEPICHSAELPAGLEMDDLFRCVPAEFVACEYRSPGHCMILVHAGAYAAVVHKYSHHAGNVTVRAATTSRATAALAETLTWFPTAETEPTTISVDFWQAGRQMFTTSRAIEAPEWAAVGHHYPGEVRGQLDSIMQTELSDPVGRVILWHGPPGTGKTSAIRSLARSWRDQATMQIVLDPGPVFSQSAKLMQVILNSHDSAEAKWRVLVIEDADEIVRADNVATTQSLSRLLNVGDGIVGQGLKVLVLLTTNEPPARLHPALTRPGRCLANTPFRKFTSAEAQEAFGSDNEVIAADGHAELSLAEILTGRREDVAASQGHGQYL